MKWKCVLMMLGLGAAAIHAEDDAVQLPATPVLELPPLNLSGSDSKLPSELFKFNNKDSTALPVENIPPRPRPATTGTTDKNKDWLVNGLLDIQKKQQEEKDALKQKHSAEANKLLQQEFDRQQKALASGSASPFDSAKSVFATGSGAASPSAGALNLPNGRLSLSGSNSPSAPAAGLPNFSELTQPGKNLFQPADAPNSPADTQNPYNPALPLPSSSSPSLNMKSSQWDTVNVSAPPKTALPAATSVTPFTNPAIQPATVSALPPQPALPAMPAPFSSANGGASPFTPAQAASFLQQQEKMRHATPATPRPTLQNLNNIPNPSNMRRF